VRLAIAGAERSRARGHPRTVPEAGYETAF
jgi:hypothetical protein